MLRAREDVDLPTPADVYEPRMREHPLPLCFQQSTRDSAAPEIDVILGVLRHFLVDDDVRDLDSAVGFEDPVDLLHDGHLIGAEVDHRIADNHIN